MAAALFAAAVMGGTGCEREPAPDRPEIFMWMGGNQLLKEDPGLYDNMLLFAARQGVIPYESGAGRPDILREFLERSRSRGIARTWIEIGPGKEDVPIEEFVSNPESRAPTLERFRELARIYRDHYPDFARITIFDEAPLGAFGGNREAGYGEQFRRFRRYAPEAFSHLYRALKDEHPRADVGIFLHHPHNASPGAAGPYSYIAEFMRRADSLGATPDFIYSDVYRGYFNRGYGVEATDRYIRDVVSHTREVARRYGARAYQLGQMHTIKLGYTPSRRQIDENVTAMLEAGADGIGWYWPNYASTDYVRGDGDGMGTPAGMDVSYHPFVPNSWGRIGPAGSVYGTSRDRFSYAYLRALEATGRLDAGERFDLWIYGHDFDHNEHRLYLKAPGAPDSAWTFIGRLNPQQDAGGYEEGARPSHRYSYNGKWHAVAFHGLRRSDFMAEAGILKLEARIETEKNSDGSRLAAIYAQPYHRTRHYLTEEEITRLIERQPRWVGVNSLAAHLRPVPLPLQGDVVFRGGLIYRDTVPPAAGFTQWMDSLRSR